MLLLTIKLTINADAVVVVVNTKQIGERKVCVSKRYASHADKLAFAVEIIILQIVFIVQKLNNTCSHNNNKSTTKWTVSSKRFLKASAKQNAIQFQAMIDTKKVTA